MSKAKNTEQKEAVKAQDKLTRNVTSQKEFKNVEVVNKIIDVQHKVSTQGSRESTKVTHQLRNGTVRETFTELFNKEIEANG